MNIPFSLNRKILTYSIKNDRFKIKSFKNSFTLNQVAHIAIEIGEHDYLNELISQDINVLSYVIKRYIVTRRQAKLKSLCEKYYRILTLNSFREILQWMLFICIKQSNFSAFKYLSERFKLDLYYDGKYAAFICSDKGIKNKDNHWNDFYKIYHLLGNHYKLSEEQLKMSNYTLFCIAQFEGDTPSGRFKKFIEDIKERIDQEKLSKVILNAINRKKDDTNQKLFILDSMSSI